jgi:hypothetical protein
MNSQQMLSDLESLGDSPGKVAETLAELKIFGFRHETRQCPLANFLLRRKHFRPKILGCPDIVEAGLWDSRYFCRLPAACLRFHRSFDEGRFPGLELYAWSW